MKYKMIVLDLDGTLTNSKKEITPRTLDALMQAQQQGMKIVLASGRPTYGIVPLADQLQIAKYDGYILSFNGGKVTECKSGTTLFEQKLEENLVPQLYKETISAGLNILTYKGNGILATSDTDQYVQHEAFINKMPIIKANDFLHEIEYPINKCLVVGDPTILVGLEKHLASEMNGKISVYRSADFFLECVPLGIDKAESLKRLIASLDIKREEVIACGDGHNDLSMIRFAGLGVAMDNAAPEVKVAADYVTASNEEDGIAELLQHILNC